MDVHALFKEIVAQKKAMSSEEWTDSGNQEILEFLMANLLEGEEEKTNSLLDALEYDQQNKMKSQELVAYLCQPKFLKEIIRHAVENTR